MADLLSWIGNEAGNAWNSLTGGGQQPQPRPQPAPAPPQALLPWHAPMAAPQTPPQAAPQLWRPPVALPPVPAAPAASNPIGDFIGKTALPAAANFAKGMVQGVVNPVAQFGNEVGALGLETGALAQAATGHQPTLQQNAYGLLKPGGGLFQQGGVLQGREFAPGAAFIGPNAGQNIRATIGEGAQLGSLVASPEAGLLAKGSLAARVAKGAVTGAGLNTLGGAGQQLAAGQFDPGALAQNAAAGAVLGGGAPLLAKGVGKVASDFKNGNEIGAIGKNVNSAGTPPPDATPAGTPTQVDKIAAATPVARKAGASDAQIKQILEQGVGSNRAPALRVLEQHQANLSPADRLALTGGDTGQAGLVQSPADRAALMQKMQQMRQQAAAGTLQDHSTALPPTPPTPAAPTAAVGDAGKTRGFTTSVQESRGYSKDLKQAVDNSSTYQVASDKQALANTDTFIRDKGLAGAHADVLQRLHSTEAPNKQLVVDAGTVMQHLDSQGRYPEAQALHDLIATKLTDSGQTAQAAHVLLQRSPEHVYNRATTAFDKAGIKPTPEMLQHMAQIRENIRATAPDSPARSRAMAFMDKYVADHLPSSTVEKTYALWRAGLLSGARTLAKIATSHTAHSLAEVAKEVPARGVDLASSLISHKQSLALTPRGAASGFVAGAKRGIDMVKTGIETNPGANTSEYRAGANFGIAKDGSPTRLDQLTHGGSSKVLNAYANIGRIHGSFFQPYAGAFHDQSLYSQAIADARNLGLKGAQYDAHVQQFVSHPSPEALNIAQRAADQATFQQKTALGQIASSLQQKGGIIGKVIAPFTRIPSAIATDVFNYSPAGAVKTIVDGIKAARSDTGWTVDAQRQFSQGLGRSITGSAAMVPGFLLFNKGMINLGYPTDKKEQQLWEHEGRVPNSVLIGGQWRSLGSIGPVGSVLLMGGQIAKSLQAGESTPQAFLNGLAEGAKSIQDQSFLQGVSGVTDAIKNPGTYLSKLEKNYAGSLVPTLVSNAVNLTDPVKRQVNSPLDALKNNLPGLHGSLPVKIDAFGQPVPSGQDGNPLSVVDPFYSSNQRGANDPLLQELRRLQNAQQGVMPTQFNKVENLGGTKVNLTPDQQTQLQTLYGQAVHNAWNQAVQAPGYQQLNDLQKSSLLSNLATKIEGQAKQQFAQQNAAALNQQVAKAGTTLNTSGVTAPKYTPQQAYQKNLLGYQLKNANGLLTSAQSAKSQAALTRQSVTSNYSTDITKLYGMSKSQIAAYLQSNPQTASQTYSQLQQLDQQLHQAGATTKLKFSNGLSSTRSSSRSSGGTRRVSSGIGRAPRLGSRPRLPRVGGAVRSLRAPRVASPRAPRAPRLRVPSLALQTPKISSRRA